MLHVFSCMTTVHCPYLILFRFLLCIVIFPLWWTDILLSPSVFFLLVLATQPRHILSTWPLFPTWLPESDSDSLLLPHLFLFFFFVFFFERDVFNSLFRQALVTNTHSSGLPHHMIITYPQMIVRRWSIHLYLLDQTIAVHLLQNIKHFKHTYITLFWTLTLCKSP